ncbi:unnamed protein product, partial [Hydatigera taeniaeformis]|uniref:UBA domain-containing protein n=1 Tax=Hydatigena taeniaeformis TaxID=6205 RepID=A0A0R3WM52_HYDTA
YDFDLEREILKGYEEAECEERQEKEQCGSCTEDNWERERPLPLATPQMTMIEPEKTVTTFDEPASSQLQPLLDRSLVEDFEFQGPKDDPFVAAELGTINDLEELRDVLASMSMPSALDVDAKRQPMFSSLKNINFPRLSNDDAPNETPSSAPNSQPNLFLRSFEQFSEEPAKSSTAIEMEPRNSQVHGVLKFDPTSFHNSASPIRFDIDGEIVKSKDSATGSQQLLFERAGRNADEDSNLLLIRNMEATSLPSSYPNSLRAPISLDEEAKSISPVSPTLSEYVVVGHVDDPPIVPRLVKMGFERNKILALYYTSTRHDDALITQLCNWTELEERGFEEEVGKAAVIFSPDDFKKALEFATMVSELSEMGFPLDSVISAVLSSKMDKEEAALHLLDSGKHSDGMPSSTCASNNVALPQSNILDAMVRQAGKKSKKKLRKSHLSSYLNVRH